jgi:hypothetical protein
VGDGTHQISFKMNENILDKFLIIWPSYNRNLSFLSSCDVTSFHQKLKIIATKVSKEDLLSGNGLSPQPYLKQPCVYPS